GARGGTYPWGETPPGNQLCWKRIDSRQGTCKVGSYPAGNTPLGVQDMAGNVREWVQDQHCPYLDRLCKAISPSPSILEFVTRGGAWGDTAPWSARSAFRGWSFHAWDMSAEIGFRCARDN